MLCTRPARRSVEAICAVDRRRPQLGGRGLGQHRNGVAVRQVGPEDRQRTRVVLTQRAAQLVELTLAGPHQVLMRPGGDLDRLGQVAVTGHTPVVVPVGASQVGEHLGVAAVGLRARQRMTVAVAVHRLGVDREHLVSGRNQRADQQARISLNPDHHLAGVVIGCGCAS